MWKSCSWALAFVGAAPALAQHVGDASAYYCIEEISGGLSYDSATKNWKGSQLQPKSKFVLRIKLDRQEPMGKGSNLLVRHYMVTLTPSGTSETQQRADKSETLRGTLSIFLANEMRCTTDFTEYWFNLKDNRFVAAYMSGYVDGRTHEASRIMAGTCTKID
jgi:hypothetical protein